MRSLLTTFLALCFLGLVNALSVTGGRLLVVLDDVADKDKYSQFWGDLQGELHCFANTMLHARTNTHIRIQLVDSRSPMKLPNQSLLSSSTATAPTTISSSYLPD